MKRKLLEILCCPICLGSLTVEAATLERDGEIFEGVLRCSECSGAYAILHAVPRMIPEVASVRSTKNAFQRQWSDRISGRGENRSIIFAQDVDATVRWLHLCAQRSLHISGPGSWCLDAGCGSAEKTREFAKHARAHQVVGLDLSDTVAQSAAEGGGLPNLHFVQGDILRPPFRNHAFAFVVSYAVLHHTPDTARAFEALAFRVAPSGTFLTWIYPLASEYPSNACSLLYRQRDRHFLALARHLPPWLILLWCRVYVALLFPLLVSLVKRISSFGAQCEHHRLTLKQQYDALVFYTYDNVAPYYQHRHGRAEVLGWYRALDFDDIDSQHPGLYVGNRSLRRVAKHHRSVQLEQGVSDE